MDKESGAPPWAIEIIYYSDPYCTWCWGSEPILRHLEVVLDGQLSLRYKMGGLVENIDDFYDPANDISSIKQVAPHWLEASARHGMPVDITIFNKYDDEIRSTYPSGIAYKAAELVDEDLAVKYLRRLREAAAALALPIHRRETQLELAEEIGLDADAVAAALDDGRAEAAFLADVNEARDHGISSFPTFVVRNERGEQVALRGFQPFDDFAGIIDSVHGTPLDRRKPPPLENVLRTYKRLSTQEAAEIYGVGREQAAEGLEMLVKAGKAVMIPAGTGEFWDPLSNAK